MEQNGPHQLIKYFPKSVLSYDAKGRFEDLFKIRKKWRLDDILPYGDVFNSLLF